MLTLYLVKRGGLRNLERYEEALELLDKALALDPENSDALHNKGVVLFSLGQREEAIELLDKAIEIDPENSDALHITRASCLFGLADIRKP